MMVKWENQNFTNSAPASVPVTVLAKSIDQSMHPGQYTITHAEKRDKLAGVSVNCSSA